MLPDIHFAHTEAAGIIDENKIFRCQITGMQLTV